VEVAGHQEAAFPGELHAVFSMLVTAQCCGFQNKACSVSAKGAACLISSGSGASSVGCII
jgi:hypothetical protein